MGKIITHTLLFHAVMIIYHDVMHLLSQLMFVGKKALGVLYSDKS